MSRCLPYPPPGYEKSASLVESIKLQKEERAKKERREKKRGKKEKKEKPRGVIERPEDKRHSHRKRHYEELSQSTYKSVDYPKAREDESEQLEKSSITEEQGCPRVIPILCDSSDSTQNSSKRINRESVEVGHANSSKRINRESVLVGHATFGLTSIRNSCDSFDSTQSSSKRHNRESAEAGRTPHGNRIRLPLSRHKDLEPQSSSAQFSQRTKAVPAQLETSISRLQEPCSTPEQPCFSGRTNATTPIELQEITDHKSASGEPSRTHHADRRSRSSRRETRRLYKKLILEWCPPPLQMEHTDDDDQDWLFGKTSRGQRVHEETREQAATEDLDLGSALCSWPPRACYLPEVGTYALPYVVPF